MSHRNTRRSSRRVSKFNQDYDDGEPDQEKRMKVSHVAEELSSLEGDVLGQSEHIDSQYQVMLISDFDLGGEIQVEDSVVNQSSLIRDEDSTPKAEFKILMEEQPRPVPVPLGRKIITLKKSFNGQASEKTQNLILDCIVSLPDQEQLMGMKLMNRRDPLRPEEWRLVVVVLIELLHVHFKDNDKNEDDIDYATLTSTRLALKETYPWAGYVDLDFQPTGYLKKLSDDGCYNFMRRKNNSKKSNQKKAILKKNSRSTVSKNIKRDVSCVDERLNYKLYCDKLSNIPSGFELDDDIVEESRQHVKCFNQDMKDAKPADYEDLLKAKVFDFLRHFQVYNSIVEGMVQRKNVFKDFELQCKMYLHCLDDLMHRFPPSSKKAVLSLDIEKMPYISLATIIGLQLGKGTKIVLDVSDMNEEGVSSCGPVFLVRQEELYDVWMETVLIAGSLTECQALFVFVTLPSVLGLTPKKGEHFENYYDLIDFMRKFVLMLPEFVTRQKEVLSLGRAFLHFSYRALLDQVGGIPISVSDGARLAQSVALLQT